MFDEHMNRQQANTHTHTQQHEELPQRSNGMSFRGTKEPVAAAVVGAVDGCMCFSIDSNAFRHMEKRNTHTYKHDMGQLSFR